MGQIARWIDSLNDAQRDRIIEHPDPTYRGAKWWETVGGRDCGCLVGCALTDGEWLESPYAGRHPVAVLLDRPEYDPLAFDAGIQFPHLTERFGPERMWRVCKARAARRNRVEIPASQPRETVAA